MNKPTLIFHADWGSKPSKRWCAKATLGEDGRYTASSPTLVGDLTTLLENLRAEAGALGFIFAGFDFPIGVPAHFAKRAGISKFPDFLSKLGTGDWKDFYAVCDTKDEISIHRPFYPNGSYTGRRKADLFQGHGVTSIEPILRQCERGGDGQRQACCLFWTLGGNQVGKAALIGWRDVLAPALRNKSAVRLWPFDGSLQTLFVPGALVVAETYPAECYGWFSDRPLGSKGAPENRQKFSVSLLGWAEINNVIIEDGLRKEMRNGFLTGDDDAFDAVVGLFGMLRVCLGQRCSGEPNDRPIRDVEGWILGRRVTDADSSEGD
jgi:hypothetical protein